MNTRSEARVFNNSHPMYCSGDALACSLNYGIEYWNALTAGVIYDIQPANLAARIEGFRKMGYTVTFGHMTPKFNMEAR